jgi:hypothetical protein
MEETSPPLLPVTKPERPILLTVLCILTFIGSGMNIVSNVLIAVFFDAFRTVAEDISKTFNLPGMQLFLDAKPVFFVFNAGIYVMSLAGAIQMFRLFKRGFHLYTIAQILLLMAPMIFFKLPGPSLLDLFLSGIFVILYSINLKYIK